MQTPNPTQNLFLDDLLRSAAATATAAGGGGGKSVHPAAAPIFAQSILQAWAELRDPTTPSDPNRLLSALRTLSAASRSSLHVADPHAKLLLPLLSSTTAESLPHLLRLLYAWLRKSPNPSPQLLSSAATAFLSLPTTAPLPQSILLLGALSAAPTLPPPSRSSCLDLLCRLLDEDLPPLADNLLPDLLAGLGYALARSGPQYFTKISSFVFRIWDAERGACPSLANALMVLRLVEWCVSGFIATNSLDKIKSFSLQISEQDVPFAVVTAAAGVLRASRMAASRRPFELDPLVKDLVEGSISSVAQCVVSGNLDAENSQCRLVMQCVALGLARCGSISFSAPVLRCLCLALLNEIFPLSSLLRRSAIIGISEVREHLGGALFSEAGAVTGVFCNQYGLADEESRITVENQVWEYAREVYANHRVAVLVLQGRSNELLGELEKVAEAVFLMVVVFAAEVSKHKLNSKSYREAQAEAAVEILVAFSCVEYLRRVRLPEYTDAVRRAVLTIQENANLCASFVESMPSYSELTNQQGQLAPEGRRYVWSEDEVQTARMLFYLRVIPTCVALVPSSVFGKIVAPTMFLYLQHPNEKVARASHSVFVAFTSSGRDSEQDERLDLKEQLVFFYVERSLEVYPGVTPFEGLASGVAALVRYLPAGSAAIFYCVHNLVEKATGLFKGAISENENLWKNWEGNSEPCRKVLDLLLRLISLTDIQVFPYLLKRLAEFVVQLPKDGQNVVLDEMYAQAAESDDVTRKPLLVSWLQSLSYLCSQKARLATSTVNVGNIQTEFNSSIDGLTLNTTSSRL